MQRVVADCNGYCVTYFTYRVLTRTGNLFLSFSLSFSRCAPLNARSYQSVAERMNYGEDLLITYRYSTQ